MDLGGQFVCSRHCGYSNESDQIAAIVKLGPTHADRWTSDRVAYLLTDGNFTYGEAEEVSLAYQIE